MIRQIKDMAAGMLAALVIVVLLMLNNGEMTYAQLLDGLQAVFDLNSEVSRFIVGGFLFMGVAYITKIILKQTKTSMIKKFEVFALSTISLLLVVVMYGFLSWKNNSGTNFDTIAIGITTLSFIVLTVAIIIQNRKQTKTLVKNDIKKCWHVWITGENALEILISYRDSKPA